MVQWNACGRELDFLESTANNEVGEGVLAGVIAKIRWMQTHGHDKSCTQTVRFKEGERPAVQTGQGIADVGNRFWQLFEPGAPSDPNRECQPVIKTATASRDPETGKPVFDIEFAVSWKCMRRQINVALTRPATVSNLGTEDLPCGFFKEPGDELAGTVLAKTGKGDWDVNIRGLLRALYVAGDDGQAILDQNTRDYVMSNFLTASGPLEEDSYSIFECGNEERDTGLPQDRADERSWTKEGLLDDLGDLLDWLKNRLLLFVALAVAVLVAYLALTLGSPLLLAVAAVVAGAGTAVAFLRIPESENHLFMINTSRYLTNRLIIQALPDEDDREFFEDDQEGVKDWLLEHLQDVVEDEFLEYNSRPYQRYTILAIRNLYDFSGDDELKRASEIVLDFAMAKIAAGSSQGRRAPPFRRLMENIPTDFLTPPGGKPRQFFDLVGGADHMIAEMLFFAAQTQQLPKNKGTIDSASQMIYAATSPYRPDPIILSVAINKSKPYEQRMNHDGYEAYSSTPSFLISAGGVQTGLANEAILGPVTFTPPKFFSYNADRGVAMPTLLFPHIGRLQTSVLDLLRIEGPREHYSDVKTAIPGVEAWSFDHNLCLRRGFACGTNIVVPPAIEPCLAGWAGAPDQWRFIDSMSCPVYGGGRRFYVALYRQPCTAPGSECLFTANWGFFEAVDDPGIPFDEFRRTVIAANPPSLTADLSDASKRTGTYVAANGDRIAFDVDVDDFGQDDTGIESVNGNDQDDADDWEFAEGDVIKSDGDGKMEIHDPATGRWIEIDFSDRDNPKRTVH